MKLKQAKQFVENCKYHSKVVRKLNDLRIQRINILLKNHALPKAKTKRELNEELKPIVEEIKELKTTSKAIQRGGAYIVGKYKPKVGDYFII